MGEQPLRDAALTVILATLMFAHTLARAVVRKVRNAGGR